MNEIKPHVSISVALGLVLGTVFATNSLAFLDAQVMELAINITSAVGGVVGTAYALFWMPEND